MNSKLLAAVVFKFIDVVLLILSMVEYYDKILYIDFDVHHGDGVENAFIFSDKVFTFSMHKYAPGFFPGSGGQNDQGKGKGSGYCLNIPINHKISGEGFYDLFKFSFSRIIANFDPDIIVCVCGADVLSTDPHAAFNVGSEYYSKCVSNICQTKIPTVFLGGGNYYFGQTFFIYVFRRIQSSFDCQIMVNFDPFNNIRMS